MKISNRLLYFPLLLLAFLPLRTWAEDSPQNSEPSSMELLFIVFAIFTIFPTMWFLFCHLLASMGWKNLASKYAAKKRTLQHSKKKMTSGLVNWVNYQHVLFIGVHEDGLWLSVNPLFSFGHKPLIIPWEDINETEKKHFFIKYVQFEIDGTLVRIYHRMWPTIQK